MRTCWLALALIFLVTSPGYSQGVQKDDDWWGMLCNGKAITHDDLASIIQQHAAWYQSQRRTGKKDPAVLKGADLRCVNLANEDLRGIDLSFSDLSCAILTNANLSGADLRGVTLVHADLRHANLTNVNMTYIEEEECKKCTKRRALLDHADLRGANLQDADLRRASLADADLGCFDSRQPDAHISERTGTSYVRTNLTHAKISGADLSDADLTGAVLVRTKIKNTDFTGSAMAYVVYEPKPELPDIYSIARAQGLEYLRFNESSHGLEELRGSFNKDGFKQKAREITRAIKHSELLNRIEKCPYWGRAVGGFFYVIFELTCNWGLDPVRCLWILIALWAICVFPYMIALKKIDTEDGIWRVAKKDLASNDREKDRLPVKGWRLPLRAMQFSVISAFSIGWRELNIGYWLARLQFRDYTLEAVGWCRLVSGAQSLISVYLLALWVITTFGDPFYW